MMTLSVQHFHATSHLKALLMSQIRYSRSFTTTIKESLKFSLVEILIGPLNTLLARKEIGIRHQKIIYRILTSRSLRNS